MKRAALLVTCLLACAVTPAWAADTTPTPAASTPESAGPGVPSAADIDAAAVRLAQAMNGVLRNCPAAYAKVGTPDKRCVGVSGDVETVREQLGTALGSDLFGVWRSRDDQRTVFNWVKLPSGAVYLRIAPDETAGRSLIYLDAPTVPASAVTTPTPATPTSTVTPLAATPAAQPSNTTSAVKPVVKTFQAPSPSADGTAKIGTPPAPSSPAPLAFQRSLALKSPRLNGPDVLAAQTRLIALTLGGKGGKGDGWYGPNTAKTVRDFQSANSLRVTGVIDRATWNKLFSPDAKKFKAAGP